MLMQEGQQVLASLLVKQDKLKIVAIIAYQDNTARAGKTAQGS